MWLQLVIPEGPARIGLATPPRPPHLHSRHSRCHARNPDILLLPTRRTQPTRRCGCIGPSNLQVSKSFGTLRNNKPPFCSKKHPVSARTSHPSHACLAAQRLLHGGIACLPAANPWLIVRRRNCKVPNGSLQSRGGGRRHSYPWIRRAFRANCLVWCDRDCYPKLHAWVQQRAVGGDVCRRAAQGHPVGAGAGPEATG